MVLLWTELRKLEKTVDRKTVNFLLFLQLAVIDTFFE